MNEWITTIVEQFSERILIRALFRKIEKGTTATCKKKKIFLDPLLTSRSTGWEPLQQAGVLLYYSLKFEKNINVSLRLRTWRDDWKETHRNPRRETRRVRLKVASSIDPFFGILPFTGKSRWTGACKRSPRARLRRSKRAYTCLTQHLNA